MTTGEWTFASAALAGAAACIFVAGVALAEEHAAEPLGSAIAPAATVGTDAAETEDATDARDDAAEDEDTEGGTEAVGSADDEADPAEDSEASDEQGEAAVDPEAAPELAAAMVAGEEGYLANCRACHGSRGTAGVPLAGNDKVSAGFDYLGWAILTGPGYMPAFHEALTDQEIADISTFILNSWGNSYGLVLAEDIEALR